MEHCLSKDFNSSSKPNVPFSQTSLPNRMNSSTLNHPWMNVRNFMDRRLGTSVHVGKGKEMAVLEKNLVRVDEKDGDLFERKDVWRTFHSWRVRSIVIGKMYRFDEI